MILLSQPAQAATTPNDFWWAQPGATLLGGALVFAAAWVAYAAQANTRKQERTHHLDRLEEEGKARAELVEAQREEWEARIVHERMEARRTEAIQTYKSILEFAAFCKNFADGGFLEVADEEMPRIADFTLIPVLCPPGIAAGLDALKVSAERFDAQGVESAYEGLRQTVRDHLKTFDVSPRQDLR